MKKLKYVQLFENFIINEGDGTVGEVLFRGAVIDTNVGGFGFLLDTKEINKRLEEFFECDLNTIDKKVRPIGNIVILYWKDKEALNKQNGPEVEDIQSIAVGSIGIKDVELKKGYSLEEFKETFCK